jgi:glycogen debranching enzyme
MWQERADGLAATMDDLLWDDDQGLWSDAPVIGGGGTASIPTLDGVLGALVTPDAAKATRALDQLIDPDRFAAPYGLTYVARDHPAYDSAGYWRGTAWMQMNYLAALAAQRWGRHDIVNAIAVMSRAAVEHSRFAEHWNPETGQGHGAIPLTWSALVITFEP